MDLALGALYSEDAVANGITTDMADLIFGPMEEVFINHAIIRNF